MTVADIAFLAAITDNNNPKFELNGSVFDFEGGFAAATDTRRLAIVWMDKDVEFGKGFNAGKNKCIVPKSSLKAFVTGNKNKHVDVEFEEHNKDELIVRASLGDANIITSGIKGTFVDIERIIPKSFSKITYCKPDYNLVVLAIAKEGILFELKYLNVVNSYLKQASNIYSVTVGTNGKDSPFLIQFNDGKDATLTYIIMPMVIGEDDYKEADPDMIRQL